MARFCPTTLLAMCILARITKMLVDDFGVIARVIASTPSVFCGIVSSSGKTVVPVDTALVVVEVAWTTAPLGKPVPSLKDASLVPNIFHFAADG